MKDETVQKRAEGGNLKEPISLFAGVVLRSWTWLRISLSVRLFLLITNLMIWIGFRNRLAGVPARVGFHRFLERTARFLR
jgi:hypothetical protein